MRELIVVFSFFCTLAQAQTAGPVTDLSDAQGQPLWEIGVFAASFDAPQYPGSSINETNTFAAPFVIYRGDIFRIGDGAAARAVAIDTDWLELDLSVEAAFNADSEDNPIRQGMPDLDYLFEIGPQLTLHLARWQDEQGDNGRLSLQLQARSVFSTNLTNLNQRGYVFHPELVYTQQRLFASPVNLFVSVAPLWASERLHDYFFEVAPEFSNEARARFDASGGYLGSELTLALAWQYSSDVRVFFGGQWQFHQGFANRDSPLFQDNSTLSVGLGVAWQLYQSDQKVTRRRR